MSAFERAAQLFDQLSRLSDEQRATRLVEEADPEVRALVAEMLEGADESLAGLTEGLHGLRGLVEGLITAEGEGAEGAGADEPEFCLAEGPYRIDGVLARGGMGLVLRGRDASIGRDVAIKVLRARSADRPDARLRFVEEAQVAGQLEHPGIVPIHSLAEDDHGRPFFAMKLVEGRTLAELLRERSDPVADRPRLLGHMLRVAEAVAYAHARGVIHRDLKPANIMVGAFGEVQVLDWGLAKVLGTTSRGGAAAPRDPDTGPAPETVRTASASRSGSGSLSGTVMGTPGYMPPEQALGEVERLDRRADVFALGAILCEVLTGYPPFPGDRDAAWQATCRALLEPAHARLAASGADPELVALVTRCLSADPDERPCDAGQVAAAIGHSFAAAEQRAQDALLDAERSAARAASERRARRATSALSAGAALVVLLVVVGALWLRFEREQERDRRSAELSAKLDVVDERLAVARAAPVGDLAPWEAAAAALQAAVGQTEEAEDPAASPTLRPDVVARRATLRARFASSHREAREAAERLASDQALLARLEEIRAPTGEGLDPWDYPPMERAYRELFRELDLDVADYDVTAAKLQTHRLAEPLALALDQWSLLHQIKSAEPEQQRTGFSTQLLWLAVCADPHPDRNRIRRAIIADDVETLEKLAEDVGGIPPESAVLMAGCLRLLGRTESAINVIRRMVRRHPDDYWLSFQGAIALRSLAGATDRSDREALLHEAVSYFRGALGTRPHSDEARHLLGLSLRALSRVDLARAEFAELVRREPDDGHWLAHLGECTQRLEGPSAALPILRRAVEHAPDDTYALSQLAYALLGEGNPWAALSALRRAWELEPKLANGSRYADALHFVGDLQAEWALRRQLLDLAPNDPRQLYSAAIVADTAGFEVERLALLERGLQADPEMPEMHCNHALACFENGRFAAALESWRRGHALASTRPDWNYPSADWIARGERGVAIDRAFAAHAERGVRELGTERALELIEM